MPTSKADKIATAKKNAEAEKAKKKNLRDGKVNTAAAAAAKTEKKGPSLINQSKTKKK
ncbi:MAG: hypothetical protein ACJA0J_002552 [Bdellovibrionota bacterium]|jgi:hypothetical protein